MRLGRMQFTVLLVLILVAGCARGGPDVTLGRTPPPNEGYGASAPAAPAVTGTQALAALLVPTDLGRDFTQSPGPAAAQSPPCSPAGTAPLTAQLPPAVSVSRGFAGGTPASIVLEELDIYPDAATALRAVVLTRKGLDCPIGHSYQANGKSTQLTIAGPTDLTAGVGKPAETATAWVLSSAKIKASIVVVRVGADVVVLTYAAALGAAALQLPKELPLVKRAVARLHQLR